MAMKRSRWDNGVPLLASGLMLTLAFLNYQFPARYHNATDQTITLAINPFATTLIILGILAWLGCLVATVFATFRQSWFGYLTIILFLVMPVGFFFLMNDEGEYRVRSTVVDHSGATYCFIFPTPGMSDAFIAKQIEKSGIHTTYEKLVIGDLDIADGSMRLVRPKGSTESPSLFLTDNHWLVGTINKNMSVCVYDLNRKVGYHFDELNQLSPFLVLAKDDTPSEEDFKNVRDDAKDIDPETYRGDLKSSNARVREMAQELLTIHDQGAGPKT